MKFVVQYKNGKKDELEIEKDNLVIALTHLWNAGLDGVKSMTNKTMQSHLDSIFKENAGEKTFTHKKKIDGVPMGLKFEGTWHKNQFTVEAVTLYDSSYNPKKSFKVEGETQMRSRTTAIEALRECASAEKEIRKAKKKTASSSSEVEIEQTVAGLKEVFNEGDKDKEISQTSKPGLLRRGAGAFLTGVKNLVPHSILPGTVIGVSQYAPQVISSAPEVVSTLGYGALNTAAQTLAETNPLYLAGGALVGTLAVDGSRRIYKQTRLSGYESKTDEQLDQLSDAQKQAFMDGVRASNSLVSKAGAFLTYRDYRHPNAYTAGLAAGENKDEDLINRVKLKLSPN